VNRILINLFDQDRAKSALLKNKVLWGQFNSRFSGQQNQQLPGASMDKFLGEAVVAKACQRVFSRSSVTC